MTNGIDWMARRIMAGINRQMENQAPGAGDEPARFNPKPPGICLPGSATEAVFAFLQEHPNVFFSREQILRRLNRSEKAVDWALLFLRTQNKVVVNNATPPANTRHLRYAFMPARGPAQLGKEAQL